MSQMCLRTNTPYILFYICIWLTNFCSTDGEILHQIQITLQCRKIRNGKCVLRGQPRCLQYPPGSHIYTLTAIIGTITNPDIDVIRRKQTCNGNLIGCNRCFIINTNYAHIEITMWRRLSDHNWWHQESPLSDGSIYIRDPNLVATVPEAGLTPNNASPSAGTVPTKS